MDSDAISILRRANGLLLDTNVLLLLIVNAVNPQQAATFKRTRDLYFTEGVGALTQAIASCRQQWTTPHVLTETSNFLGQLPKPLIKQARQTLQKNVVVCREHWTKAADIHESDSVFHRFGMTDWAINKVVQEEKLVLVTDDYPLYQFVSSRGIACVNYNHLRTLPFD